MEVLIDYLAREDLGTESILAILGMVLIVAFLRDPRRVVDLIFRDKSKRSKVNPIIATNGAAKEFAKRLGALEADHKKLSKDIGGLSNQLSEIRGKIDTVIELKK